MARMTVEEAVAVSDYFINNEVTLGPNGSGWLSQQENNPWGLENSAIKYILLKATENHKSPAQIINEMVTKELAAAV